jgi:hypothetical protein
MLKLIVCASAGAVKVTVHDAVQPVVVQVWDGPLILKFVSVFGVTARVNLAFAFVVLAVTGMLTAELTITF